MNIFLWILQILLAVHTAIGAVWKFSHSVEETAPSLSAIPNGAWVALGGLELLFAAGLVLPTLSPSLAILAPIAAICIAAEMLLFSGVHLASGASSHSQLMYWSGVEMICLFIVYGRLVLVT